VATTSVPFAIGDFRGVALEIEPKLRLCEFEELSPGDLFIYFHDNGSCVALKAEDPTQNGEKLIVPFGPAFPRSLERATSVAGKARERNLLRQGLRSPASELC
jgi:hypothetical protein